MFGPLKEDLESQRFDIKDEIDEFVRKWVSDLPKKFYDIGIKKTSNVANEGNYVEKLNFCEYFR